MTDISEKSDSLNSDKISIETRISIHKYHNKDGDGPEISYPFCDINQLSLQDLNTENQKIQTQKLGTENKPNNDIHDTLASGHRLSSPDKSNGERNDKIPLKDRFSNKTFPLSSLSHLAIADILRNIQLTFNELQLTNSSAKNQIATHLEQINSYNFACDYNSQIQGNTMNPNNLIDAETQRLQVLLLYIVEQLNHLNGTISDTKNHIAKTLSLKLENMENHGFDCINGLRLNNENYKVDNKHSEGEDDIFSVEELSWDEHLLPIQRLEKRNKRENITETNISNNESTKLKTCQIISSTFPTQLVGQIKPGLIIDSREESINERSVKTEPSKLITPPLSESIVIEKCVDQNIEKSNSFQEIKSKFEKLKISPKLTETKEISVSPSFKGDREILSIKRSSGNFLKSRKSKNDPENLSRKYDEDCVDNSAFLVSSIDSYTESISFTNPNNNNNRFSDKYKTNITNIIENKEINTSVAVDLLAERFSSQTDPIKDSNHSYTTNKIDQYIEVVNNTNLSNEAVYIDSPYVNYQNEKRQDSKSSNSSSEHIIAMGKLITRYQKAILNETQVEKNCSPVYEYIKDLVDTEKNYVNGLFIYTQILHNRIKVSNIISHRNFSIMFPNCIHRIYKFHVDFCNQLNNIFERFMNMEFLRNSEKERFEENKTQTVKFGQIFLENIENDNWKFFSLYRQFYWKFQSAVSMFNKLKKNSPKFERLIKILQHNEHCNNLELGSFIVLPVKRLPSYLSMLRRILNKLNSTQIDEKIPMLAIEHLLESFLKEMEIKEKNFSFKKSSSKTSESTPESSINSIKDQLNNEIQHKEDVSSRSQESEGKHESVERVLVSDNMNKIISQSTLINDFIKDSCPNLDSETQYGSISIDRHSNKDNLNISNSISRKVMSHPRNISFKLKASQHESCKFQLGERKSIKDSKSVGDYNLKESTNHQRIDLNVRPQSVPLHMNHRSPKKFSLFGQNPFDSDSLTSQATDECSVCLNSQDEFEIDTSIEEDEKTCTAETNAKLLGKNHSNSSSNHDSLSPQNSANYHLIEFCADSNIKYNNTDGNYSIKWFLSDQNKFAMLSYLLVSETDCLINRKVKTIVLILSHVLIETMKDKSRLYIPSNETNGNSPSVRKEQFESCDNGESERSTEFDNHQEGRKDIKKFSIKQLFSLRRKIRTDPQCNLSTNVSNGNHCNSRSFCRSSSKKKLIDSNEKC